MKTLFYPISAAIMLTLLACHAEKKDEAPEFVLQTLDGVDFDASQLKGRIVVVDFWATWCKPCIEEMPAYNALYRKFKSDKFEMLGVTMASGEANDVKAFIQNLNIEYPIYMGDDKVAASFGGIMGFPTTFIIDQNWSIVKQYLGGGPQKIKEIESIIESLLEQDY